MDAGARALAGRVEPRDARAAVEIRDDAAHRVVGSRRDGDRLERGIEAFPHERLHERREAAAIDRTQVEQRPTVLGDRASDDVARRELVGEAVTRGVDEHRPLAAQSLAQQQAVLGQHGRVELHELEIGESRARVKRHGHAITRCARRVCRSLPERRGAAGGDKRRPCLDGAPVRGDAGPA